MTLQKIEAHSPEAQSADIQADNLAQLKALFPELVTEGANGPAINVDVLKALVGDRTVTDADEKYGLNWHGKKRARQLALTPSTGTLRPCPEESVDWDSTRNLMIEGDNLEVLKLLQKSYAGKVKLIYIDPPYNTGKDFVYPDNFQDNIRNYLELTGQTEGGAKISSNTEASGRFHTDWLNMMYSRLKLARTLLSEDGVILVSLDDAEQAALRLALNEIFGEENFVEQFIWKKSYGGGAKERYAVTQHEYCLMYSRNISALDPLWLAPDPSAEEKYYDGKDEHFDRRGPFRIKPLEATKSMGRRENLIYPIKGPDGSDVLPKRQWWWSRERVERVQSENGLVFVKTDAGWSVSYKQYLIAEDGEKRGAKPFSVIDGIYTQHGTASVRELFDDELVFSFPKPVRLLTKFIEFGCTKDGLVLDFFAGSGTLGQAVMEQNSLDGGARRYILVQLPEPLDPANPDQKVAADYCDRINAKRAITELTKERLRRSGEKIRLDQPLFSGDLGFRVFTLDTSNIRPWNPRVDDLQGALFAHQEHLAPGRSSDDILYEILLKLGLDLCTPIETRKIAGKPVSSVGAGVLMACLAESIQAAEVEALALGLAAWRDEQGTVGDTTAVFRDSAFENDVAKSNLAAILEQHGIKQVRSL
ncbi:site-specific DNA-methyltransferase [Zoogloea sp.]|uniref:site-specific DNA-methyltransferase n=1 Tax=Zoogloea sp. TaxID=49181 RepID=UPI0026057F1B|nr:site-specific DNA-methyltransferase [uncultured Zoogloea sp.]